MTTENTGPLTALADKIEAVETPTPTMESVKDSHAHEYWRGYRAAKAEIVGIIREFAAVPEVPTPQPEHNPRTCLDCAVSRVFAVFSGHDWRAESLRNVLKVALDAAASAVPPAGPCICTEDTDCLGAHGVTDECEACLNIDPDQGCLAVEAPPADSGSPEPEPLGPDRPRNEPENRIVYLPVKVTYEGLFSPNQGPYFKGKVTMSPDQVYPQTYSISESQVIDAVPAVIPLDEVLALIEETRSQYWSNAVNALVHLRNALVAKYGRTE